jgi:hypothetical protein
MVAMQLGKFRKPNHTLLPRVKLSLHSAKIIPNIIQFLSFKLGVPHDALRIKLGILPHLWWCQIGLGMPGVVSLIGQ